MADVRANRDDEAARAEAKMGLNKDALITMLYAALVVPSNLADGVTIVEDFLAWV